LIPPSGQPAPSTTVPAGVLGHLSNRSDTPSPSLSVVNLIRLELVVLINAVFASTSAFSFSICFFCASICSNNDCSIDKYSIRIELPGLCVVNCCFCVVPI